MCTCKHVYKKIWLIKLYFVHNQQQKNSKSHEKQIHLISRKAWDNIKSCPGMIIRMLRLISRIIRSTWVTSLICQPCLTLYGILWMCSPELLLMNRWSLRKAPKYVNINLCFLIVAVALKFVVKFTCTCHDFLYKTKVELLSAVWIMVIKQNFNLQCSVWQVKSNKWHGT